MIIAIPSSSLPPPPQFPNRKKNSPIEKIEKKYQKNKIIKIKFFIV
jgi:hypothetical protein